MGRYVHQLLIESEQMVLMARTMILPAALEHQERLARTVSATADAGVNCPQTMEMLDRFVDLVRRFSAALDALAETNTDGHGDPFKQARHLRDKVLPRMVALRELGDELETLVAADLWPLPSYRELLFIK